MPKGRRGSFLVPVLLLFASPLVGEEAVSPSRDAVVMLSGERIEGVVTGIDGEGVAVRTEDATRTVPLADLYRIRRPAARDGEPTAARRLEVHLRNGDRVVGEPAAVPEGEETIGLHLPGGGEIRIPLGQVEAVRAPSPDDSPEVAGLFRTGLDDPPQGQDRILLRAEGSAVSSVGVVLAVGPDGIAVDREGQTIEIGWDRVAGFFLFLLPSTEVVPAGGWTVRLAGGGEIGGTGIALADGNLELAGTAAGDLAFPWDAVSGILHRSDRLVYLSDLDPARSEMTPFFDYEWPVVRDRALEWDGEVQNPITLGGVVYEKGLCVHSKQVLEYNLDGQYRAFAAVIGVDDETWDNPNGAHGNCVFRVLVDGETVFDSGNVRGGPDGDAPRAISIDVTGARILVLEVDYGEDLDIADHADWADARLIR